MTAPGRVLFNLFRASYRAVVPRVLFEQLAQLLNQSGDRKSRLCLRTFVTFPFSDFLQLCYGNAR